MARTKAAPKKERPAFVIRSLTLARDTDATLQQLSTDATDYMGRKVSGSAVVRALLRLAEQQSAAWLRTEVFSRIEQELTAGVTWGTKPRRPSG